MRVTRLEIPPDNPFGFNRILMDRLGEVVVLAGKNGAGKTRLLDRLIGWTEGQMWPFSSRQELKNQYLQASSGHSSSRDWLRDNGLKNWMLKNWGQGEQSSRVDHTLGKGMYDVEFGHSGTPIFAPFVPKQVNLANPEKLSRADFLDRATQAENLGVTRLHDTTLARIQRVQDRWWTSSHQSSSAGKTERKAAAERYEQLNALVARFIGVGLKRDLDDRATLFEYPIATAPLSDGQKILLQFCVAIHAQADKLSELIVLMDEPENHLHPGAMLDAIEQIQPALTDGQLWIATHSIPLLAHFEPENIWWMEDGRAENAGSTPEKVLSSLLGNDARIARLSDFLGLPAALAASRFARECLLPPNVLSTVPEDPQTRQIARLLENFRIGQRLRLLDFGAGRGRLISALSEYVASPEILRARIDYRAFEPDEMHHVECENAIIRTYGDATARLFQRDKDVRASLDASSVDIVVLCNVLHEIDVTDWLGLFSASSLIRTILRNDGFLLVVEDTEMRIGERAHQRGFLVLDTAGLKALFGIAEAEEGFVRDDARGDGRLQAHLIPQRYLANANSSRLVQVLQQVRELAMEEIKTLRAGNGNYRQGRRHAFHVQQLANAHLALAGLGSPG